MKDLGVFITTHMEKGYRHGTNMEKKMFSFLKDTVIKNFTTFDPGVDCDVFICDTGSNDMEYLSWVTKFVKENEHFYKIDIPNLGGFLSAQKYLMHNNVTLSSKYKYFLFMVDDDGYATSNDWGKDLIEKWNACNNLGVMGRFLDKIRIGPTGLIDHRNCCPHIAKMYDIKEVTTIPHLHANWWLMDYSTLRDLSKVWWDPVKSDSAMEYQKKWEQTNFCTLADIRDGRKTIDNIHIGRETEVPLRMNLINKHMGSYKGTKFWPNCIEPYKTWTLYEEYNYESK